jgi:uroporphyrinogen decarboxylase
LEAEVRSKLEAVMPGGGYIYHSDHSIPSDVCFEDYNFMMELIEQHGWHR